MVERMNERASERRYAKEREIHSRGVERDGK